MKTQVTLNGITKEIDLTPEQVALFENKFDRSRAEDGGDYYFIDTYGEVAIETEYGGGYDSARFNHGNYYRSKELAEYRAAKQKLDNEMQRHADQLVSKQATNSGKGRWYVWYNSMECKMDVVWRFEYYHSHEVYFRTEEQAKQASLKYGDRIKALYEWRCRL